MKRNKGRSHTFGIIASAMLLVSCVFLGGCAGLNDFAPSNTGPVPTNSEGIENGSGNEMLFAEDTAPEQFETCIIAQLGDVMVHSPIKNKDLTGVLFHQASYEYGLVMSTQLPEVQGDVVEENGVGTRINREQWDGSQWLDADALHLYRVQDSTAMDTSIDVGAPAGSTVYSPVSGTVVLVKDYMLYGYVPDIEIHIQPDGHPELDVVLLHQYDPTVRNGDRVVAGQTPISKVRDICADLSDVQLGYYTAGDDPGNHSHVQINDALYPGYYAEKLLAFGAFVTLERSSWNVPVAPVEPAAPDTPAVPEEPAVPEHSTVSEQQTVPVV